MEALGKARRAQADVQHQGHGAGDGQGDPGGGLPRPARRGGGDDTEEAGGERAGGARGGEVASDVLCGGVVVGRRIESLRIYAQNLQVICTALYGKPNRSESYHG